MTDIRRLFRRLPKAILWSAALIVVAVIVVFTFSFADEPIRRRMEAGMNAKLTGYSVQLPNAHFQLFGLTVTLEDVQISQSESDSGPPIAVIPKLQASLQWKQLLRLRLVSDLVVDSPRVHLNLANVRREVRDSMKVKDRGWQEAVQEIHPFKINSFKVTDGEFTYVDSGQTKPLHVTGVNARAENIRNIASKDKERPSTVEASGVIFGQGQFKLEGSADFLATPSPSFQFDYTVNGVPLEDLSPVASHVSLKLKGGVIRSAGSVETGNNGIGVHIRAVNVDGLRADYQQKVQAAVAGVAKEVQKVAEKRRYTLIVDTATASNSEVGVSRLRSSHSYRLYLTNADFTLTNYSNHFVKGPGDAVLRGRFMGSGRTVVRMHLRPAPTGPNFSLAVAIDSTPLTKLNEMLLAHGKLDVAQGTLEFYSELNVRDGQMNGYVKPILEKVKVYDPKQDGSRGPLAQLWQLIVSGAAQLFENRNTKELAIRATVSGPVGNSSADVFEVIGSAFENAFIQAIRPGFDRVRRTEVAKRP